MTPELPECAACAEGHYRTREITGVYRVGNDVALVTSMAEVCDLCGDTLLSAEESQRVDRAVLALRDGTFAGLQAVGTVYVYEGE